MLGGHPSHTKICCLKWKKQCLHFSVIWRPWVLVRPGVNWTRDPPLTVERSTDWTNLAAIEVQSFSGVVVKPVSSEGKGLLLKKCLGKWNIKVLVSFADLIESIYQRKKIEKLTYRTLSSSSKRFKGLDGLSLFQSSYAGKLPSSTLKEFHKFWLKQFIFTNGKLPVSSVKCFILG